MATNQYTINQLANAHVKTDDQIIHGGKVVYTLTPSDLTKVNRFLSRTNKRIAYHKAQKDQFKAAHDATQALITSIHQRESRIAAMAKMVAK